ncbi:MAG: hypothetical protein KGL63_15190, partial [Betaproteobacteria bacterium]|nr:hypothetical protein [Betaproteobacteria bacterium]
GFDTKVGAFDANFGVSTTSGRETIVGTRKKPKSVHLPWFLHKLWFSCTAALQHGSCRSDLSLRAQRPVAVLCFSGCGL